MPNATRCVPRTAIGALVVAVVAAISLAAQAPDAQAPDSSDSNDNGQVAYAAPHDQPADTTAHEIKTLVSEARWEPGNVTVDWRRLKAFYIRRDFRPAWANTDDAARALDALRNAADEGLNPADYAADAIEPPQDGDAGKRARYDVLLTNSLLLYAHDVREGRIRPEDAYTDAEFRPHGSDYPAELAAALQNGNFDDYLKSLPPPQAGYRALRTLLGHYRHIAADGGWPTISEGGRNPSRRLKQRLAIENGTNASGTVHNQLSRFQEAHGLKPTGVPDHETVAELNVSARDRVTRIEANMERWRWLPRSLEQRYVEVNVPGAYLNVVDNAQVILNSRIVVGREKDPTPLLRSDATAIVINPSWHIPSKIARKEVWPKYMRHHSYFRSQRIKVVDGSRLEQLPGPKNPLGTIKIDMPNRFNVYLHDTPGQSVFARNLRDESHGCMRVEQILGLASIALAGNPDDAVADLTSAIDSKETQTVALPSPLPIYVVYWTVTVGDDGSARFWPDIYGRDAQLSADLQKRNVGDRVSVL